MIKLNGEFTPIPEGTYIFKITKVEYKPDFGKLNVTLKTEAGKNHTESFMLIDKAGNPNSGAMAAFSFFAKAVMNDFTLEEIDEQELVGRYIRADIEHTLVESKTKPGEIKTYAHVRNPEAVGGYDGSELSEDGFVNIAEGVEEEDDLLSSLLNQ